MHRMSLHSLSQSMIHLAMILAVVASAVFLPAPATAGETSRTAFKPQFFGEPLELEETVSIATILEDPEAYRGQRVRVEGRVREVCPKKGCWMDLVPLEAATGDAETLRIKVEDDVIVFPGNAVGAYAVAEGVVEVLEMDREKYVSWLAHQAEERGEDFDASGIGEGPFLWVQVKGAGARLSLP